MVERSPLLIWCYLNPKGYKLRSSNLLTWTVISFTATSAISMASFYGFMSAYVFFLFAAHSVMSHNIAWHRGVLWSLWKIVIWDVTSFGPQTRATPSRSQQTLAASVTATSSFRWTFNDLEKIVARKERVVVEVPIGRYRKLSGHFSVGGSPIFLA